MKTIDIASALTVFASGEFTMAFNYIDKFDLPTTKLSKVRLGFNDEYLKKAFLLAALVSVVGEFAVKSLWQTIRI